jgi:hypothetical protein
MERLTSPNGSRWRGALAAVASGLLAVACGGGGSAPTPGTAPQGVAEGTVTGFGSIIVDGVRYDDRGATVSTDSEPGAPDAPRAGDAAQVRLGHHVELEFHGDDDSSSASRVSISATLIGPVTAVSPQLVVAGQTVTVNSDPAAGPVTVFEGYTGASEIQVGDRVEVHGIVAADGTVQATRIERKPATATWVRVSGTVADLAADGKSFELGGLTVLVDSGTRIVPANTTLAEGQRVVVWSRSWTGPDSVVAAIVRVKRAHHWGEHEARLAGPVTDCTPPCASSFKVGGISVDASDAVFAGGTADDLANGRWVRLRGSVDPDTGIFKATKVKLRHRGDDDIDVRLRGAVTDFVDMTSFKVRGVPVTTDENTEIAASCPSPLVDGTLVVVRGEVRGLAVLAEKIECFTSPDGVTLEAKGRIEAIDADKRSFTLARVWGATLAVRWTDTTAFPEGKSAADLAAGQLVRVWGTVEGGVLTATRIDFCDDLPPPGPGIALFETEGVASGVTRSGDSFTGLTVNGLAIEIVAKTLVVERDGPLVDGAKVKVVFFKDGTRNVALLVRTDDDNHDDGD